MKKKRFVKSSLSLLLALTLVLGTAGTVFAEGEPVVGMNEAQESVDGAHNETTGTAVKNKFYSSDPIPCA